MKILVINTNDYFGGAARAAYRLFYELRKEHYCNLVVLNKTKQIDDVIKNKSILEKIKLLINVYGEVFIKKYVLKISNMAFSINYNFINVFNIFKCSKFDIIHLHWVNDNFFDLKYLKNVNQPVVLTLHDSWLFTGGCHIPYECTNYNNGCRSCPYFTNKILNISRFIFNRKVDVFKKKNITVVCPSHWLFEKAKSSLLLKDKNVVYIPNGIDTNVFNAIDKEMAKNILGIGIDEKVILFGAVSSTTDKNKGFIFLKDAINKLYNNSSDSKIRILIFGAEENNSTSCDFQFKTTYLGTLHDDISLKIIYSAADVFVMASLSENLPNVLLEAMACKTPCVCFNVGGVSDIVEHKKNGYLASLYNTDELMNGIKYILTSSNYDDLKNNARDKIVNNFDIKLVVKKYICLYEKVKKGEYIS